MLHDIWQLLKNDTRVIVKSETREGLIVTWNNVHCVLELWHLLAQKKPNDKLEVGWGLITGRSCPQNLTFEKAKALAQSWLSEFITPAH